MTDDRVVQVLEEVRDLQRQLLAAYGQALENQREAIRTQREAARRARTMLGVVGVILLFVFVMVVVLLRYVLRHYV
jgi:CHASE3 domain sensor protein